VLFKSKDQLFQVNHGYSEFRQMQQVIEKVLEEEKQNA